MLNSVISFYYYLRPVVAMYFHPADEKRPHAPPVNMGAASTALVVAAIFVLVLGLMPSQYLQWATQAVALLGR